MPKAINEKIMEDTHAIVSSTLQEGQTKANEILADATRRVGDYRDRKQKEIAAQEAEIIRRRVSVANLEVKKVILQAKMEILDKTFNDALEMLINMPKKEYLSIISSMLKHAEDGDTVCIAARDKGSITKSFIKKNADALGIKLELSPDFCDIKGGVILSSKNMDKNLSIEMELLSIRQELESEIAKKLFGELS